MKSGERVVKHIKISESSEIEQYYLFGEEIGEGSFGKVISVKEKNTNRRWAIKSVPKSLSGIKLVFLQREIQILKMVDHPHIIYLDKVYESPQKIFLVMELCNGELWLLFREKRQFSENIVKRITLDLVSAVAYLHKNDIVHRDLKLENILLAKNPNDPTDDYYIKLTDFGLSVIKSGTGIESMLHDCCGTAVYMAPEMITGSYSQQCDVWAIGVITYLLLYGTYPFYSTNDKDLNRRICKDEVPYPPASVSNAAVEFLKAALRKDPAHRITSAEMLESGWLCGNHVDAKPNIIEMMKEWRNETMMPKGEESDWISVAGSRNTRRAEQDGGLDEHTLSASRNEHRSHAAKDHHIYEKARKS